MNRQAPHTLIATADLAVQELRLPQVSEREREFWRRAVAVERQRLETATCPREESAGRALH